MKISSLKISKTQRNAKLDRFFAWQIGLKIKAPSLFWIAQGVFIRRNVVGFQKPSYIELLEVGSVKGIKHLHLSNCSGYK